MIYTGMAIGADELLALSKDGAGDILDIPKSEAVRLFTAWYCENQRYDPLQPEPFGHAGSKTQH